MTSSTTTRPQRGASLAPDPENPPRKTAGWFRPMILRLHFYAGVLVGPFILLAALTGAIYAVTPQLEKVVYAHELTASDPAQHLTLDEQVHHAVEYAKTHPDGSGEPRISAVRPAPEPGATTRVMFELPDSKETSTQRAVFVSPSDGAIRGDLTTYGSTGSLPLRRWTDELHRNLHLGETGRLYSEFAASWMWIIALAGLILWTPQLTSRLRAGRSRRRALREAVLPAPGARGRRRLLGWHYSAGLGLLLAMVFLSATGITWSGHAGQHVSDIRAALSWASPEAKTSLTGNDTGASEEHAGHEGHHSGGGAASSSSMPMPTDTGYDAILRAAHRFGISARQVEIVPSGSMDTAWTVQEVNRHYPTQVDVSTIDPMTYREIDHVSFQRDYSLPAKLARWGVDIHMGLWWGAVNQAVLLVVALGIAAMVVTGYWMWFKRRPRLTRLKTPRPALIRAPWWGWAAVGLPAVALGWFLPLFGLPLAAFVAFDVARWALTRQSPGTREA